MPLRLPPARWLWPLLGVALVLAALLGAGVLVLPVVLGAALAVGLLDTVRTSATQAYAYDLAPTAGAARGLAFVNLGAQLLGTLGGLVGGYTLERFGAPATFVVIAGVLAMGAVLPAVAAPVEKEVEEAPEVRAARRRPSLREAVGLVLRNRLVAALVGTIIVAEILGFSSNSVMPTFARDVFMVGAAGLGTMTAARSLGGAVGLAVLSRIGTRERSGGVMLGAASVLGVTLLAFAQTARFELALVWLVAIGAASAVLDTLGQTLLQQAVPARQRGAAMGTWVFAIGFGPVGHLGVGMLASSFGAPLTLTVFGSALAAFAVLVWRSAPLRSVR